MALGATLLGAGERGEVDLAQRLLDQAAVIAVVERLARDLLGRDDREVGYLLADLVERAAGLGLDVLARRGHQLLAVLLGRGLGLVHVRVGRLARAGDDVLRLLTGLLEPGAVLLEQLVGLDLGPRRSVDRLLDRQTAAVECLADQREGELAQDQQRDAERDQRPEHQPDVGRYEEASALLLGAALSGRYQQRRDVGECLQRAGLEEEGDQAEDERVEGDGLRQREAEPANLLELVLHLGLAGDRLDLLAEDDADADAGADRAKARAYGEGDCLAGVGDRLRVSRLGQKWQEVHLSSLVVIGGSSAEIDGSQGREDECLQRRHKPDLEEEERDRHAEREDAERRQAEQHDEATGHEQDQQVAGEDVGEQSYGQRDDPDEVRDDLDDEQRDRGRTRDAGRHEALREADEALHAYALDVVGDPDDERQGERDREVRRRGVDRQRRDLDAEDVDRVLGVGRQRQVAKHVREPDEEEERRDEREPPRRHRRAHVLARDVVARHVVGDLDGRLDAVRAVDHAAGDVDHRQRRGDRRQEEVHHSLGDRHVDAEDVQVDPRVEAELLLRLEGVVTTLAAEEDAEHDRYREPDAEADQDLVARPHERCASSIGLTISSVEKKTVNRTAANSAAASPASRSMRPTAKTESPISHSRATIVPASTPIAARRSPVWTARRAANALIPRCASHAADVPRYAISGSPAIRNSGRASASTSRSKQRSRVRKKPVSPDPSGVATA